MDRIKGSKSFGSRSNVALMTYSRSTHQTNQRTHAQGNSWQLSPAAQSNSIARCDRDRIKRPDRHRPSCSRIPAEPSQQSSTLAMLVSGAKHAQYHRSGMPYIRRSTMRTIYLLVLCLWLNAWTAGPLFSQEIANDITSNPSVIQAWKEQAGTISSANFLSKKVQLGGRITHVLPKPGGVVIIAEEQPFDRSLGYGATGAGQEKVFSFAIVFSGFPDEEMLKPGNQLAVVGETDAARPEVVGSMPIVALPHLVAQCLHIWKAERSETEAFAYEGVMGYQPSESRTFCRKEDNGRNLSTSNDRRFQVPRPTTESQSRDASVSAQRPPVASEALDLSLGKY